MCLGGMVEMQVLYGVIALDLDALLCLALGSLRWCITGSTVVSVGKEEVCEETSACVVFILWG